MSFPLGGPRGGSCLINAAGSKGGRNALGADESQDPSRLQSRRLTHSVLKCSASWTGLDTCPRPGGFER
jgi:hypothetical protein